MDHYCVVAQNIVGARNHGHFVLMVVFGNVGLLYCAGMLLWAFFLAWKPYWEVFEKTGQVAARREGYWYWVATGAHLHSLKFVCGWEVTMQVFLTIFASLLIGPLVKHVFHASRGVTIMETTASPTVDWIELPEGRALPLPEGSFSRGSCLANLRALVGPRAFLRVLLPIGGSADFEEEAASQLLPEVVEALQEILVRGEGVASDEEEEGEEEQGEERDMS